MNETLVLQIPVRGLYNMLGQNKTTTDSSLLFAFTSGHLLSEPVSTLLMLLMLFPYYPTGTYN